MKNSDEKNRASSLKYVISSCSTKKILKSVSPKSGFLLVVGPPMEFRHDCSSDSSSPCRTTQENLIFEGVTFHQLLINQSDFDINGERIRVPRIVSHTADYFLENSILIGFRLANQVSQKIEVKFAFAMFDNLPSIVPGAKIRLTEGIQRSNE